MIAPQLPHAESAQLLFPMPLQHTLPCHLNLVKKVTSLGRYFGPGFSQVERAEKPGTGLEGEAPGEPVRYLSFSAVSAQLPLRQSRRQERQLGMLICHELTYLQNCTQAPLGQRARPGPEMGGAVGRRDKCLFSARFTSRRGKCPSWGHIPPLKPIRNEKPPCLQDGGGRAEERG